MERPLTSWHEIRNPPELPRPSGFSHVVMAQGGRTIYLAGQTAQNTDGRIVGESMAQQFDIAAGNVMTALAAAGGRAEDLVSLQIFVTDIDEYLGSREEIGVAYRRHFGDHFPAMALLGVSRLVDADAKLELMAIAVSP